MRVLQVTTTTVYPPRQGGSHRAHGLLSAFPDEGVSVDRLCQGGILGNHLLAGGGLSERVIDIGPDYREHRPYSPFHDLASLPQNLFDIPNVALSSWLRLWPPRGLRRLLDSATLVMVEGPLQVPGIAALTTETPVVYSSHNVETERFGSVQTGWFKRKVRDRLAAIEREAVRQSDALVCTSEADAETFRDRFGAPTPIHVAPNGTYADSLVDEPTQRDVTVLDRYGIDPDALVLIFVGSDYPPNREAARALFDVMDGLAERSVDAHLLIVGDVCDGLESSPENVSLLGFVDDLQSLLKGADVAVNPITSGGGSNVKMLDYFGIGLPVVSTPFGARGFEVTDGEELLVRDIEQFSDAIVELRDRSRRLELGRNGLAYVRANHVWDAISRDLLSWYRDLFG